ncbi:MAG: hypothetical protein II949_06090 [Prevotella sp.]|nr:hypothetical protein [Prevotella sp.]
MIQVLQAKETMRSQPRRGVTVVASHFNGWYKGTVEMRAFRYATASNPCRVPTARSLPQPCVPAIKMAGYHCLMPTASVAQNLRNLNTNDL